MDVTFQYPPELFNALVETLPRLSKSKTDLLLFFQGAGVPNRLLQPYRQALDVDKNAFNKFQIARELLTRVNEEGDRALAVRRELIKRVVEFEDFGLCWEADRPVARGLVAQIRQLVNVKDSFTRMRIERDHEKRHRLQEQEAAARTFRERRLAREKVREDLFALFRESDPHRRGKALESVLNRLFASHEILVKEAFTTTGAKGGGVIEQIDGVIEVDHYLYLVEMKWWNSPLGPAEVSPHLVRVFARGGQVRGLFISYTEFTEGAIAPCRDLISQGRVVVLATLQEIVTLLEQDGDMHAWLRSKVKRALLDKQPYVPITGQAI